MNDHPAPAGDRARFYLMFSPDGTRWTRQNAAGAPVLYRTRAEANRAARAARLALACLVNVYDTDGARQHADPAGPRTHDTAPRHEEGRDPVALRRVQDRTEARERAAREAAQYVANRDGYGDNAGACPAMAHEAKEARAESARYAVRVKVQGAALDYVLDTDDRAEAIRRAQRHDADAHAQGYVTDTHERRDIYPPTGDGPGEVPRHIFQRYTAARANGIITDPANRSQIRAAIGTTGDHRTGRDYVAALAALAPAREPVPYSEQDMERAGDYLNPVPAREPQRVDILHDGAPLFSSVAQLALAL